MVRWKWWVPVGALAVGAVVLYQVALRQVRVGIEQALGPRASVASLAIGWSGVVVSGLRVRAERPAWPADDELRADRVVVVPELRSVFSEAWRVRSVRVEGAYVSVLRRRDGRLAVVPGLVRPEAKPAASKASAKPLSKVSLDSAGETPPEPARPVHLGRIELVDASVDFFDATVRQPAHRMRLERLDAELENLALPALDQRVDFDVKAVFKGPTRDGRLDLRGRVTPVTRDADVKVRLDGVDLIALEPYLLRVHEAGVKRGTLDLTLDARVAHRHLHAPGVVTLTQLELGSRGGLLGTFAGVPREAVLASLAREGRIEMKFVLEGQVDDPKFSLNEALSLRIASGLAESLGVSVGGVVQGVGGVIKGLFGR